MNNQSTRFLSFVSMSLFVSLAAVACGDDDDGGGNTGGKAGSSATGGKGGKPSGGSANVGGDDTGTGLGGQGANDGIGGQGANDGIGGSDDGIGGAGGAPAVQKARLRVVHASPNAPEVDIYPAGSEVAAATAVEYGDATDFIEVDAGEISFDLRAAGEDADSEPALTTEPIELEPDTDYTLVAAGDFADLDDEDTGFRILPLAHDFDAVPADTSLARVVHATSAWETVDVDLTATSGIDLAGVDRFASESNVAIPADEALEVAFRSDDDVLSKLTLPELDAGGELFVIATGNPGFPFRAPLNGFTLLVVDQDSNVTWVKEQPWLHVVHASDISTVDIYDSAKTAASAKLTDDLGAATLAGFQLPASAVGYTLKAVADDASNGAATALATGATATLQAGEHYLSIISADTISTIREQFDTSKPTKVILRGVHASESIAPAVDFGAVVSSALSSAVISNVLPQAASPEAGVAIDPGNVILGAAATGTTTLLAQATFSGNAAPVAGERAFILLVGEDGLWRVDTSVAGWALR